MNWGSLINFIIYNFINMVNIGVIVINGKYMFIIFFGNKG